MTTYRTRDGDVLDAICWRFYGRESAIIEVLAANPGVAEAGCVLPAGVVLTLPEITAPADEPVSLWD